MSNDIPQAFARRARLSSKAILGAVALTLAALVAIAIAAHEEKPTATVKTQGPVTSAPADDDSVIVPVVAR